MLTYIQSLATFLRKRDPRYKAHLAAQAAAASSSASMPKGSRTPSTKPSHATATPQSEFVAQDWQKTQAIPDAEDLEWAAAENAQEEWECVACGKTFRSEAAWDSHERSRKHLKAVEELKKQMREESQELGLEEDDLIAGEEYGGVEDDEEPPDTPSLSDADDAVSGSEEDVPRTTADEKSSINKDPSSVPESDDGDLSLPAPKRRKDKQPRPASPDVVKSRRKGRARGGMTSDMPMGDADERPSEEDGGERTASVPPRQPELSKREKRRAREAAKAARAEAEGTAVSKEVCADISWLCGSWGNEADADVTV